MKKDSPERLVFKNWFQLGLVCAVNLIISFVIALTVSAFVPRVEGTLQLERPASTYSEEELRSLAQNKFGKEGTALDMVRDRGVFFQVAVWAISALLLSFKAVKIIVAWSVGLAFGYVLGVFSVVQLATILGVVIGVLLLKHHFLDRSQNARKGFI